MSIAELARPEIATLEPYVTAVQREGTLRLNANEAPRSPAGARLNRYPPIRPDRLERELAAILGLDASQLLVTRGSSEGVDLLVRTFCRAYRDRILVTPPTFSMYEVYANMQGAGVTEVPLAGPDFALDVDALAAACDDTTKLVFVCSPNNPTGGSVPREALARLLEARAGRSLVVVDEAYVEFSRHGSLVDALDRHDNLVVLRTLSKAWGLAGARCGGVAANPDVIDLLRRMLPPYALSAPASEAVRDGLGPRARAIAARQVAEAVAERERLAGALAGLDGVERVWPSDANFLLVRFADLAAVERRLERERILVRAFAQKPALANCARITIGRPRDNDRLVAAIADRRRASA